MRRLFRCLAPLALAALLSAALAPGPLAAQTAADARIEAEDLAAEIDRSHRLFQQGRWDEAEALMRRIDEAATRVLGPFHEQTLLNRVALANTISNQRGRADEALDRFARLVEDWRAHYGDDHFQTARAKMNHALALGRVGRASEGIRLATEALGWFEANLGPDDTSTLLGRFNLAGLYEDAGYLQEALTEYLAVIPRMEGRTSERDRSNLAVMLAGAAGVARRLGRHAEAADLYARAIPAAEDAFGPAYPDLVDLHYDYGQVLLILGAPGGTGELIASHELALEVFGDPSWPAARAKAMAGAWLIYNNAPESSGHDLGMELALGAVKEIEGILGPLHPDTELPLLALLRAALDLGRGEIALAIARKLRDIDRIPRQMTYEALQLAATTGDLTPEAALAGAFEVAQSTFRSRVAAASRTLAARLEVDDDAGTGALMKDYTDLLLTREDIQQALLVSAGLTPADRPPGELQALRARLDDADARLAAFIDELQRRRPDLDELFGDRILSLADLQAQLGPDEALVLVDPDPSNAADGLGVVIAVSRDRADWAPIALPPDQLAERIERIRDGIELQLGVRGGVKLGGRRAAPRRGFDHGAASELYAATFGQVEAVIADRPHLLVELRGAMTALPPQLLIRGPVPDDPARADWLVRRHAVTILPSVLAAGLPASPEARAPRAFLGFADPVFDLPPEDSRPKVAGLRGALAPLPETRDEALAVAAALGEGDGAVQAGPAASEAALKQADLSAYRVLYFATHGLVAGDVVDRGEVAEPALALSAGGGEDGLLTASEVAALRLNADWVVLSACNTATGDEPGAEALSGLAQAFIYSGARALLVSHWPVESQSAVALMTDIFARRAADPALTAVEAQRRAMLAMIDAPARPDWSDPAYWAPFVLVGDPG